MAKTRCKGQTLKGNPCKAHVVGTEFCRAHDPEWVTPTKIGDLTRAQRRCIPLLLQLRTVEEVAKKAKVGTRTIARWLAESEPFRAALNKAEGAAIDAATRRLVSLADSAIETLRKTMKDQTATAGVRVRAAQAVLDYLLKLRELRSIEQRLTKLEEQINEQA